MKNKLLLKFKGLENIPLTYLSLTLCNISAVRNYRFIEIGNSSGNQLTAYGYKGGVTDETGFKYIRPKSLKTDVSVANYGIMTMNGATFDYQTNTLVTCGGKQVSYFEQHQP
jgi:hypothetical protein